jgi:hypothetical protein
MLHWQAGGTPRDWPTDKKKATSDWGVTTTILDFTIATPAQRDQYMQTILDQVGDHQDVEIDIYGHTTAVVGICKLSDGTYGLITADDAVQGTNGGTGYFAEVYDPTTGIIKYAPVRPLNFGNTILTAVIECPEPSSFTLALAGLSLLLWRKKLKT